MPHHASAQQSCEDNLRGETGVSAREPLTISAVRPIRRWTFGVGRSSALSYVGFENQGKQSFQDKRVPKMDFGNEE